MLQKPNIWAKQDELQRSYSQGYGAQLMFKDLDPNPAEAWTSRAPLESWAEDTDLLALLKQASKKSYINTFSDLNKSSSEEDVLRLISISSYSDTILSCDNLVDDEIVEPAGFWSAVGYPSDSNAGSDCEEIPSRYSSGAESIVAKACDVVLGQLTGRDSCDISEAEHSILEQCFKQETKEEILLPWDL